MSRLWNLRVMELLTALHLALAHAALTHLLKNSLEAWLSPPSLWIGSTMTAATSPTRDAFLESFKGGPLSHLLLFVNDADGPLAFRPHHANHLPSPCYADIQLGWWVIAQPGVECDLWEALVGQQQRESKQHQQQQRCE